MTKWLIKSYARLVPIAWWCISGTDQSVITVNYSFVETILLVLSCIHITILRNAEYFQKFDFLPLVSLVILYILGHFVLNAVL